MATATQRVQIAVPTYMKVDGQWQIVLPGSVIDLDATTQITGSSLVASFSERAGSLAEHGKSTPVRNFRAR